MDFKVRILGLDKKLSYKMYFGIKTNKYTHNDDWYIKKK